VAYLTTLGERALLLEKLGLDLLIIEHFTLEVAHTSARDFVRQLIDHLRMVELWVGPDFALGYQRQGNVAALKKLGAELSFEVHLIEPIRLDDMIISSTRIRSLLAEGDITAASRLLGRRPALHGKIVATMAPSDMELAVEPGLLIPASGWYSAWVDLGNERRTATAELVNDEARSIWLHLAQPLDVAMGQELRIELVKRLETGTSDFTAAEDLVYRRERGER
jgi:riboflavin kinase/FMN adenylyltransferase